MSRFLEVYIDTEIVTESLDFTHVEESISDIAKSVKDRLISWFKWIKTKLIEFFGRVKVFIIKIADLVIKHIKKLFAKCKQISDEIQSTAKESWSAEEKEAAPNKELLTTRMPGNCATADGFKSLNFDSYFMHTLDSLFKDVKEAAIKHDTKRYDELCRIMRDKLDLRNNYMRLEILGSNAMVDTDIFTDVGCEKMINTAKEVCNNVITKAQTKFNDEIRAVENAVKSKADMNKEYGAFVQKCINKLGEISTFVRDYIMNNVYMAYLYAVNQGASKLARHKMEILGANAANQLSEYCEKGWSLKSLIKSLFKSNPKQKPVAAFA